MPLIYQNLSPSGIQLGIWQIKEDEDWLLSHIPLQEEEKTVLLKLKSPALRIQRLAYRMVLKQLLGNAVSLFYDAYRKPHLKDLPGFISVSHSGEMAAAIYSQNHPVGIDIERINERIFPLSEKFLSLEECIGQADQTSAERLTLYWSAKEVLYKKDGKKGLIFKEDLHIDPFELSEKGLMLGHIRRGAMQGTHPLAFFRLQDYVLVYTP
jgi:phosphopantetheinyl transferase